VSTGLTRRLCEIVHATRYESLGAECVDRVKQAIQDGVAVALAGCRETPVVIAAEHQASLGGAPQASVWGAGIRLSVVQATCINAMAAHVLDFEPMWSPPTHAISPTVPAALALAEVQPVSGRQLIAAVAKGLEMQGRLQFAGSQYVPEKLLFHPPGVAGVMGSAVVAADLLQLDVAGLQHALGIAASRAGALLANVGSMTKCTHCGNAAAAGVDAALLARRGFTANPDVLEAPKGLIAAFYRDGFDEDRLLGFGKPFRVVDPGLAIKLFPSQYGTHYAITAALELNRQIGTARIARVKIVSPVMKYIDRPRPKDGLDGKFSLQYTAAAALLDGAVGIDTFTDERRFRPDMVELLAKTALTQDPSIPGDFHDMWIDAEVQLDDGRDLVARCRGPKGSWGVPLAADDHRRKVEDCLSRALAPPRVDELVGLLERLDELDVSGVRDMVTLIGGPLNERNP
jgi:aconitate decarboxylase